jgi:hypothetical protein
MAMAGVAGVAAVVVAVLTIGLAGPAVGPEPTPRPGAASDGPAVRPVVYSEIVDADGSALIERRLDGHSLPRRVAQRTNDNGGRTWSVAPDGSVAVAALARRAGWRLDGVSVVDGSDLWTLEIAGVDLGEAVWSADGHRLALIARPADVGPTQAIVVDVRDGHGVRTIVPEGAVLQGFDGDNALILRERLPEEQSVGWWFFRIDPATNSVDRTPGPPAVDSAASGTEDVDPRLGVGVIASAARNEQDTAIQAWPLDGEPFRTLAVLPAADDLAIDPAGNGVLVNVNHDLRLIGWDGRVTDLWTGDDAPTGLTWSAAGDYLGFTVDRPGSNLVVVELATGRTVELPQAAPVAQSILLRVVGGVPLPAAALPPVEPTPTPTAGPTGPDLAAAPAVASAWLETAGNRLRLHVDRLVPTSEGGMRIAGSMPPIDLGTAPAAGENPPDVRLLPRPGRSQILVWVTGVDRSTGWLWDGSGAARRPPLPPDWPADPTDVAWRPDGLALAGQATRPGRDGGEGIFVVGELGASRTRVIPIRGDYDRFEGWWSQTELRVGHQTCAEACPGRYAYSARLRVRDGRVTPFTAADRARGPIDQMYPDDQGAIVMSAINDDARADIRIDWPADSSTSDGPELVSFAPDRRSLLVIEETDAGTDLWWVDDPARHAIAGRVADPSRTLLAHFARRGLTVDLSPDARWALTTDRVGDVLLVELASGRTWPVDRERQLVWLPGA